MIENKRKIIVSTRPVTESDTFTTLLEQKGCTVLQFPMITISESLLRKEDTEIFRQIHTFSWILFTSKNGVRYFFSTLKKLLLFDNVQPFVKFGVIGESTAMELSNHGFSATYISHGGNTESMVQELKNGIVKPTDSILVCLGNLANNTLVEGLQSLAEIKRVTVYHTIFSTEYSQEIYTQIIENTYDIIVFFSPSAVDNFMRIMASHSTTSHYKTVCIGETTKRKLLEYNQLPLFVASKPNDTLFAEELACIGDL